MMPPLSRRGSTQQQQQQQLPASDQVGQSDIVLLEESDLYRYNDGTHDTVPALQHPQQFHLQYNHQQQVTQHHQARHPSVGSTGTGTSSSVAFPPQDPPVKYARSTHSYRSNGPNGFTASATAGGGGGHGGLSGYGLHATPFAAGSKRTASIDTIPAHYGAMRPGGPVNLFTRDYIGLLLNWVIVGFFNGAIPGIISPLFATYLAYSPTQESATYALFDIGWYFKFVFGFITDNYAINRQRRKPYIFIGWTIFIGFMLALAFMNKVEPFGPDSENPTNPDSASQGTRYVVPIMISSFAHLLANVACEGMMVEFAHREGEYDRGRTQLWCVVFRFLGEVSGGVFATLSLAGEEYGGTFASSVPLGLYFGILAMLAFGGIVVTHWFLKDEQVPSTRQNLSSSLRRVWRFIEQRQTTQVMVALFVISLALSLPIYGTGGITHDWLKADSLVVSLVGTLTSLSNIVVAALMYKWFLNTNWRTLMAVGMVGATLVQLPIEMLTTWGIVRNATLFLSKDVIAGIFEAVIWVVRLLIVVEASEPGLESTSYGFLTTIANLAGVVVRSSMNVISASWDESSTAIEKDTDAVRWHMTYQYIIKYSLRFALVALGCYVIPRQKRHLKEIKIRGAPNLVVPIVLFTVVALLFAMAITSALLAMFESTMCLKFAGGAGCDVVPPTE